MRVKQARNPPAANTSIAGKHKQPSTLIDEPFRRRTHMTFEVADKMALVDKAHFGRDFCRGLTRLQQLGRSVNSGFHNISMRCCAKYLAESSYDLKFVTATYRREVFQCDFLVQVNVYEFYAVFNELSMLNGNFSTSNFEPTILMGFIPESRPGQLPGSVACRLLLAASRIPCSSHFFSFIRSFSGIPLNAKSLRVASGKLIGNGRRRRHGLITNGTLPGMASRLDGVDPSYDPPTALLRAQMMPVSKPALCWAKHPISRRRTIPSGA